MVTIQLDKERHLKLDLNAMVKFEELTGKSLMEKDTKLTAADIRALLFASLLHEDKELTIEQVGALITPENMAEVANMLTKAWSQTNPI